jgi:nitrogen fixation NifU-like protein
LFIKVGDDGKIEDAAFQGEGCAISMASASLMTDMLKGKSAQDARSLWDYFKALTMGNAFPEEDKEKLDEDDVDRLQALAGVKHYPVRVKCATLAWRTLEAALDPKATKKVGTE